MTKEKVPLVAMTSGGPHSWIMINALRERFGDFPVILEDEEPPHEFWARRRKLLGAGQVWSMKAARLPLRLTKFGAAKRIAELTEQFALEPEPPAGLTTMRVTSVNSDFARVALKRFQPKVVFVCSTRIIGKTTLKTVPATFINYHSGINPAYRGMFGGYFALANGEPQHFGSTLHLVDEGVDTGRILAQSHATPEKDDTFHTYLWVLAAASRDMVVEKIGEALEGRINPYTVDLPSKQYFAPAFWSYIWTGLKKGVW